MLMFREGTIRRPCFTPRPAAPAAAISHLAKAACYKDDLKK